MRSEDSRRSLANFAFILRALAVALVVFGAAVAVSLLVDRVNAPTAVVDPGIASVDTTKHSRIIILHIDSWRYETAIDSTLMPQVAHLRKQGASWQLETVFEGFTIPAVRAAFAGRAETQLVSLVQNFQFHALPIGSFFLDASRLGKRTLVVAREPFVQFGPYFTQRVPEDAGRDMYALDHERPAIALRGYTDEGFDVVVCHYESADWVAHETGINSERYRREFAYADSLVAKFAAARHLNDYLLVYGDHGHSPSGEHKTGIFIPTFALLIGPDVKAGVTTTPLAMSNLRYIASHAIGITLRAAPYDTRVISQFLPIASDSTIIKTASHRVSTDFRDYALTLAVAFGALLIGFTLVRLVSGADASLPTMLTLGALFVIELYLQQRVAPAISLFPILCFVLGISATRQTVLVRFVVIAISIWFAMIIVMLGLTGNGLVNAPTELAKLVPQYTLGISAKLFVVLAIGGFARWQRAVLWTTALALLELRVWDHPAATGLMLLAGGIALWRANDVADKRLASFVILQTLVYFTLRLPLYELTWIDLFFAAVWLIARNRDDALVDALIIAGTFSLTCGWLASSLEWSFLYTLFPAHLVELQVQYFVPFILAKIPLLLVLAHVVIGRTPSRRLVKLLLLYTGIRFAGAWVMRLAGASGSDLWPLAEQGMYLATFVVAMVTWGWQVRAISVVEKTTGKLELSPFDQTSLVPQ